MPDYYVRKEEKYMARGKKKEYRSMNILMDARIREKLDEYCEITGLTMTKAIERILDAHFVRYFKSLEDQQN